MKMKLYILYAVVCMLVFTDNAYAYIDPVSGSIVLQALLAVGISLLVTVKFWWRKFIAFFTKEKKAENTLDDLNDE